MTRKIKALGLALFAVLALGAVAAQGASAAEFTLEEGVESAEITGEGMGVQKLRPETGAEPLECETLHLSGSQPTHSASAVELTPDYKECKFGSLPVTVTDHNCGYIFHAAAPTTAGKVDINCGETHENYIAVHIYANEEAHEADESVCTLKFTDFHPDKNQVVNHGLEKVEYHNLTEEEGVAKTMYITGTSEVHPIAYTAEGGLCFLAGITEGTHETGVYEGDATIKAYETGHAGDPNFQVGVTVE